MNNLITITEKNGNQVVSARELHEFLEVNSIFTTWCNRMFEYGFEKDIDYLPFLENRSDGLQGKPRQDFALTLDCAKEISMIQRTPQGKQARAYFIACEKELKAKQKSMSNLDILEMSIKQLREQESRVNAIENDVLELKAAAKTRPDYFTIVGYATLNHLQVGLRLASKLGQLASKKCRQFGFQTEEIPDPRFGKVKMYPKTVLQQVFAEAM